MTRSPGLTRVTPSPIARTVPEPSCPSTAGRAMVASPFWKWRSLRQTPAAPTLTRTSPRRGGSSSTVSIEYGLLTSWSTAAVMRMIFSWRAAVGGATFGSGVERGGVPGQGQRRRVGREPDRLGPADELAPRLPLLARPGRCGRRPTPARRATAGGWGSAAGAPGPARSPRAGGRGAGAARGTRPGRCPSARGCRRPWRGCGRSRSPSARPRRRRRPARWRARPRGCRRRRVDQCPLARPSGSRRR